MSEENQRPESSSEKGVNLYVVTGDGVKTPLSSGESFAESGKGCYQVRIDGLIVSVQKMVSPSAPLTNQQLPFRKSGPATIFNLSGFDIGDEPSLGKFRPPEGSPIDVLGNKLLNIRPDEEELIAQITLL